MTQDKDEPIKARIMEIIKNTDSGQVDVFAELLLEIFRRQGRDHKRLMFIAAISSAVLVSVLIEILMMFFGAPILFR